MWIVLWILSIAGTSLTVTERCQRVQQIANLRRLTRIGDGLTACVWDRVEEGESEPAG